MPQHARQLAVPTLLTLCILGLAGLYPIDNTDTFGHLAIGRQIVTLGKVPELDTFSYFRSAPVRYVNYEWLSDWLFYSLYRAGGAGALHALKLVLLAALAALLVLLAQLRAPRIGPVLVPLFVLAGLPAVRFRLSVRPHLFGLVLAALCLLGVTRLLTTKSARERRAWIGGLTLTHVLWVNLHGSHLFGLLLVGLAGLACVLTRTRLAPIAALLAGMLLASCVSPYGPEIVRGAIAHALDPAYRALVEEWQSWRPSQSLWLPVVLIWQALFLVLSFALYKPRSDVCRLFEALYAVSLLLMALRSLRFYADAIALTTPALATGLAMCTQAWSRQRWRVVLSAGYVAAGCIAVPGCLAVPPERSFGLGESTRGRPAAAGDWLFEHLPRARVFAAIEDAWDLMFALPEAKFLIDGRVPMYGPAHIARIQQAWSSGQNLRSLIDSTGTDVVVAQPVLAEQQPAVHALLSFTDFRLVVIEAAHCVFVRVTPEREALLTERALHTLQPGFDPAWVFAPTLDEAAVVRELALLPEHRNVTPYRRWVSGLLALKPLVHAGGRAGVAAPQTASERAALASSLPLLRSVGRELEALPTVSLWYALAAVTACELAEAQAAFERASGAGPARELLLGRQELLLREGQTAHVRAFLEQARVFPEARDDPWLARLRSELASGSALCPAAAR